MRKSLVLVGVLVAAVAGCNPQPKSVRVISESEMTASAKSLLKADAKVVKVEELTYDKGDKWQRVHYENGGKTYVIDVSTASESRPTGVFEPASK